jgi:hypothetical protein
VTNLHLVCFIFALGCLLLAAFPNLTAPRPVRWEWLAAAFILFTWIV